MSGPPIPPKPNTVGMSVTDRNKVLHAYYEENKDAIIADFRNLGEPAMLKKWGISWTGWHQMGSRWLPNEVRPLKGKKVTAAALPEAAPVKKERAFGLRGGSSEELAYLRGWRDCSLEFLKNGALQRTAP